MPFRWWLPMPPRKPVVVQRLTVTPASFCWIRLASRSSLRARAILSSASSRGDFLEPVGTGPADARLGPAGLRMHRIFQHTLGAQRATVRQVIGIAFDMDDLGGLAGEQIAVE